MGERRRTIRPGQHAIREKAQAAIDLILEGVQHTDPDVSGFFINYVRERPRDVPF